MTAPQNHEKKRRNSQFPPFFHDFQKPLGQGQKTQSNAQHFEILFLFHPNHEIAVQNNVDTGMTTHIFCRFGDRLENVSHIAYPM